MRRKILHAGGLKDLPDARPGEGYTGHAFNDWNHCDLTTMSDGTSNNENDGAVAGIAVGNALGKGIQVASDPTLGPGGSWSTCIMGCHHEPPKDVAHVQFRSKIAFKLVRYSACAAWHHELLLTLLRCVTWSISSPLLLS